MNQLPPEVSQLIDAAILEDQTFNDPTSQVLIPTDVAGKGMLRAKANGILAGIDVAKAVFHRVDNDLDFQSLMSDGDILSPGSDIALVNGSAGSILRAERIALNFLQRMSGIASDTNAYVNAVSGYDARIVDTRKTVPGHSYLDKYAVRMCGVFNHRMNLYDVILIKDNHIEALRSQELGLKEVVQKALAGASHTIKVEVEVESIEALREALEAGADIIMLDNMDVDQMRQAMHIANGKVIVDASGRINLETVRSVAETGVDMISIGGLTHSTSALDISLDLEFS